MRILLSSVRVIARHALIGVCHNLYLRRLFRNRLRRWVSIFDARICENRRANFLRFANRHPPKKHGRNSECSNPDRLGQHNSEIFHGDFPSFFRVWRLLPPDAAGLERPCIVNTFSHTPVFLPMHTTWTRNEQKVNA
jgi:hypothetical protein